MSKKAYYFIVFIVLNFGALAIGSWLMDNGPKTLWYLSLNKAPWTPPGWLFGVAWSIIMVCYSFYMTKLVSIINDFKIWILYGMQLILNINWNYIFFNQHQIFSGLVFIVLLFIVVLIFMIKYRKETSIYILLILPYALWLAIAISLNAYIYLNN